MDKYQGEKFLLKLYDKDLYNKSSVKHSSNVSDNKFEAVRKYLNRLEGSKKAFTRDKQGAVKYLKNRYYDKYVIKPNDIPNSYLDSKKKMCEDRDISYSKRDTVNKVIRMQKRSLDKWLDFLMSDDINYPMWVRYWVFQGMVSLGHFDYSKHSFSKRSKDTVGPFAKLDENALKMSMDMIMNYYSYGDSVSDSELDNLVSNGNFGKIYARNLWNCEEVTKNNVSDTDMGIWKFYEQGSDYKKMFDAINGKYTSWCIDDSVVARDYIASSDVYIYFTKDSNDVYSTPRVAVVVENGEITEIRGTSDYEQNVEPEFFDVVEEKLNEFFHDKKFDKMLYDMRKFYSIVSCDDELSLDDLKFVYEIDNKINCFGRGQDYEIAKFLRGRDKKKDYSIMYNCPSELVGDCYSDLGKDIYLYLGDIDISDEYLPSAFHCPAIVLGNFDAPYLKSSNGLENLYYVSGNLVVSSILDDAGLSGLHKVDGEVFSGNFNNVARRR